MRARHPGRGNRTGGDPADRRRRGAAARDPDQPARLSARHDQAGDRQRSVGDSAAMVGRPMRRGAIVAQGQTRVFGKDEASGDNVHQVDLSALAKPGDYRLTVGANTGRPFAVSSDTYGPLARAALNYFYQTRAGTPIEARYRRRRAGRGPPAIRTRSSPASPAADDSGTALARLRRLHARRDRRLVRCGRPGQICRQWRHRGLDAAESVGGRAEPARRQALHRRPRSGAQPGQARSLLVEARWEMDFLLAMQVPDGTHMRLPVGRQPWNARMTLSDVDASGMAHHKVADAHWTKLPTPPQDDPEPRLLYPAEHRRDAQPRRHRRAMRAHLEDDRPRLLRANASTPRSAPSRRRCATRRSSPAISPAAAAMATTA